MKNLPIGMQTLRNVIDGNCVYVDKTEYAYNLIADNYLFYFLSRPRRFGKSLFLDTLSEIFKGNKELFKGLWIHDSGYGFQEHPVIRLDMSNIANDVPEALRDALLEEVIYQGKKEELEIDSKLPSSSFKRLIEGLHDKYNKKVVVLIDEYDKPILDHIDDIKTANANRKALRGFYGVLKSMEPYLRFTFVTGVSKFTKTSLFSDFNNLRDITMQKKYANICGIPTQSLEECFNEHINDLKSSESFVHSDCLHEKILSWYDGYSWDGETKLLNPWSLINFLESKEFYSFWYASGSPRLLLEMIKKKPESYMNIKNARLDELMLDAIDVDNMKLNPLLFQTGYLTVKTIEYSSQEPVYILDISNNEVRRVFDMHVLSALTDTDDEITKQSKIEF